MRIAMTGIMLALLLASVSSSAAASVLAECIEGASHFNRQLPMVIEKYTRVVSSGCYAEGNRVFYRYYLQAAIPRSPISVNNTASQKAYLRKLLCAQPATLASLEKMDIEYVYADWDDELELTDRLRKEDCGT